MTNEYEYYARSTGDCGHPQNGNGNCFEPGCPHSNSRRHHPHAGQPVDEVAEFVRARLIASKEAAQDQPGHVAAREVRRVDGLLQLLEVWESNRDLGDRPHPLELRLPSLLAVEFVEDPDREVDPVLDLPYDEQQAVTNALEEIGRTVARLLADVPADNRRVQALINRAMASSSDTFTALEAIAAACPDLPRAGNTR
ncbi:hypothetical protein [Amycolatopsis azurea]|uniref:Uncharacterized protein n=1 Tax=Amycolatopsis azurea DSM 43854 TaxID=1238180 RepID=M2Q8A7_9PSEU|nr:hypothetical protein [Amycolatopsis azurea]EMD22906.1 hypothetical protein C791_7906 [Amycolatopsis azurea DSM 43854]OOC04271.1 hypothetical protein B0293_23730 [Amycolatopsis azurea DSM 43854]